MTAPKNDDTQGQPSTGDGGDGGKLSAGTLRGWIKEEIKALIPGQSTKDTAPASGGTGQQPPADIKGEVATALEQLRQKEDRKNRDARVDKMLEEYEKPKDETPPVERRKVEKFMRWGD